MNASGDRAMTPSALSLRLELRRKGAHALPGLIPFIMLFVYHEDPLPAWNLAVVAAVVAGLTLIGFRASRTSGMLRGRENWQRTCLTYALPPTLTLILFPAHAECASVVLCVLAFGDPAAALGGRLWGRRRLAWNPDKTWVGLACFMMLAAPAASVIYAFEARPAVPWTIAVLGGTGGAACGAIAESLPGRGDDNLRISLAAAVAVVVVARFVGGEA